LSEAVDHGITVTEIAALDKPVDVSPETTAAFVGRALRGPLNTPVLVTNFGEFRRRFGGTWQQSSLGPAVQQFFAHGGKRLYVVRVANSARGAMICLPADGSALVLRAVEPGSTESIRAAIDHDRIEPDDDELFNLTLQRVNPTSQLIEDQEYFDKVSWREDAERFVGDVLLASTLARVEPPYPRHRPEPTISGGARRESIYVGHVQAGTDGKTLSDYDLVGSRHARTGLFALEQVEQVDIIYMPPPGKGVDAGPAAVLAAELYCRERRAVLVVDPRVEWTTAEEAIAGVRHLGYASPNMVGYFPRVVEGRGPDAVAQPAGGAIAGLLCKLDRTCGPWQDLDQPGMGLQRQFQPGCEVDEDSRALCRAGLNVIAAGRAGRARVTGSVTMGRGSEGGRRFASLPVRRFCLQLVNVIERATKWAVLAPADPDVATKVRRQVVDYLARLDELGALAESGFIVECDVNRQAQEVSLLLVFHPTGCYEPVSLTLHLTTAGCRVGSAAFVPAIDRSA